MTDEAKNRVAELLREELLTGKEEWYYISFDGREGALVPGMGPTDAWKRMHALNLWAEGATGTHGPLEQEVMDKVPNELRLVRLPVAIYEEKLK